MTNAPRQPSLLLRAALAACLLSGTLGFQASGPATAPAGAGQVPAAGQVEDGAAVVVTAVEGKASARTGPDAAWQMVETGMRLPVGAEIRTGPRARVTCSIPPAEEFVVDRMSNVTVAVAERRGNRQQTRLMMQYGRTAARVEAAGIEHDMRISTPATTASVKGTEYTVYDQPPFAPELRTYTGLVDYRFAKRQISVGRGSRSENGRGTAETALLASVVDPSVANARTQADAALIANEVSRGAVLTYDPNIRLNEIRGGAGPQTDTALVNALPGKLNFVLRWNQDIDVDIFVTVQPGDQFDIILNGTFNPETFLFPGFGLQTTPSGGRIPYNHRGGPNGGQEICFWPESFPTAVYGFSALNNSSESPVDVRMNAFIDSEKISLYTFDPDGALVRTKGVRRTLDPDGTQSAIVLAPPLQIFEDILPESPDETLDPSSARTQTAASVKQGKVRRAKQDRVAKASVKAPRPVKNKPARVRATPKPQVSRRTAAIR